MGDVGSCPVAKNCRAKIPRQGGSWTQIGHTAESEEGRLNDVRIFRCGANKSADGEKLTLRSLERRLFLRCALQRITLLPMCVQTCDQTVSFYAVCDRL